MGLYDREYYRDEDDAPRFRPARPRSAVAVLIVINAVIFFVDAFTGRGGRGGALMEVLALHADLLHRPWNAWQLLTAGFAHAPLSAPGGIFHLAFNMFGLFVFGRPLEQKYGSAEFVRFYLLAIVAANAVWAAIHLLAGPREASVLGASGGVTAAVILFALNYPHRELLLFGMLPIRAWVVAVMFVLLDLASALNPDRQTAVEVHLAGAAFAALYFSSGLRLAGVGRGWGALLRRPRLRVHRPPDDRLKSEADRILQKIHEQGEASLTRGERRKLERYSRWMRHRRQGGS